MFHYDVDVLGKRLLDFKSQFTRVAQIIHVLHIFEYGVFALLTLFAFTVATIIYSVMGNSIFFHRDEIEIMDLV